MNWTYVLIPLMASFIGWISIWLAIKVLVYRIPQLKPQVAEKLGRVVSSELLSFTDIEQKITHPDNIKKILPQVEQHIDEFLRLRLKEVFPMISMFIGDKTINQLKAVFMQELETLFPAVLNNYMSNLKQDLDLERIVTDKVNAFSNDQLKEGLYGTMSRELRLAGLLCALLGLVTGILQVLLIIFLKG
jgi:uncharacterized membrane protein YheB (UPF0754 family)